jgi:hypothetical protein
MRIWCLHIFILIFQIWLALITDEQHIPDRPHRDCEQHLQLFIVRTFVHDHFNRVRSHFHQRGDYSANHQKEPEHLPPKPDLNEDKTSTKQLTTSIIPILRRLSHILGEDPHDDSFL